tara:strand:- start:49165 stop:49284 length:120 start_codon:yes stop_codon:yes gene_type:complete
MMRGLVFENWIQFGWFSGELWESTLSFAFNFGEVFFLLT